MGMTECVRQARKAKGWTQRELARNAGVTQATVSRIEQGHQFPCLRNAIAISQALGCKSPEALGYPLDDAIYYTLGCSIEKLLEMIGQGSDPYDLLPD